MPNHRPVSIEYAPSRHTQASHPDCRAVSLIAARPDLTLGAGQLNRIAGKLLRFPKGIASSIRNSSGYHFDNRALSVRKQFMLGLEIANFRSVTRTTAFQPRRLH